MAERKYDTKGLVRRIEQRLSALGLSARAASLKTGRGPDVIRNIQRAAEKNEPYFPRHDTIDAIGQVLEAPPNWLVWGDEASYTLDTPANQNDEPPEIHHDAEDSDDKLTPQGLPIRGNVAAGLWHEIDAFADPGEFERAPVVVSPNFPVEAQYALRVVGTSINRIASEGDFLRCIDVWIAGLTPRDGDLAIVEQRRNGEQLREVTAKRIRQTNGILRLEPESTDPKWQPILLDPKKAPDGIEARIIAIVDLVFRPVTRL
jgi:SOS-response transcriptional repressor LexA